MKKIKKILLISSFILSLAHAQTVPVRAIVALEAGTNLTFHLSRGVLVMDASGSSSAIDSTIWLKAWKSGLYTLLTDSRLTNSRPASDVYSWAKASVKPSYTATEIGLGNVTNNAQWYSGNHPTTTTDYGLPAYPTTLPASDVYSWAKSATKPTYTYSEVGAMDSNRILALRGIDTTRAIAREGLKAPLISPSFTTPNIGVASGTSLAVTGAITSSGAGIGYASGVGGTVTQGSSRTTGVTLSKLSGTITMYSSAVAAAASSTFTWTNTFITATDIVIMQHNSSTNACSWKCEVICGAGTATVVVKNISAAGITEATPLKFVVIKTPNN
jgi:hypothetical protein